MGYLMVFLVENGVMAVVGYMRKGLGKGKAQRNAVEAGTPVDKWFIESSKGDCQKSPVLKKLLGYIWHGDEVVVHSLEHLGNCPDRILKSIKLLQEKGATLRCHKEKALLNQDTSKALLRILPVLLHLGQPNVRSSGQDSCANKTARARRPSGRSRKVDYGDIAAWRDKNNASITETASHFGVSISSVKRAWREQLLQN